MSDSVATSVDRSEKRLTLGVWYTLMLGLLYPAVLGSIFYSLLSVAAEAKSYYGDKSVLLYMLLSIAIVIHFCVDYIYISLLKNYDFGQFVIDLLVIIALYKAYYEIDPSKDVHDLKSFLLAMVCINLIFLPQEFKILVNYIMSKSTSLAVIHTKMIVHTSGSIGVYFVLFYFFDHINGIVILSCVSLATVNYVNITSARYKIESGDTT